MSKTKCFVVNSKDILDPEKNPDLKFSVGTPSLENGDIDLTAIKKATQTIAEEIQNKKTYHSIIIKSTVVPGTTQYQILPLLEKHSNKKAGKDFGIGMNPEFLREGVAVHDFLHPDRIINGYYDEQTKKTLQELYKNFTCPKIQTDLTTAEMIKYASNCFLATKISFINEIGNYCKQLGIDTYKVADGMGLDKRIQRSFLNAGIGWGGSCFGKDTKAMQAWAKKQNLPCYMIKSSITVNDYQPLQLITILKKHIPLLNNKTIAILGLAFKPDTDDIRDSRATVVIDELIKEKAKIKVYDPKAMKNFKKIYPTITYCTNAENTIKNTDAILITTEWDEFNKLDFTGKIVIDGRRLKQTKNAKIYEGVCW